MNPATDLDDRLTDLLARAGASVDVQPDLDAVLAGSATPSPVVDLGRRPRDTRRLLAVAAAVVAVVGLAVAAVVASQPEEATERAEAPAGGSGRFPVFGHLPAELEAEHVEATDGEGTWRTAPESQFRPETPIVRAALGRVADDGTLSDLIHVVAGAEVLPSTGPPGSITNDHGYSVVDGGTQVDVLGPDTTVLLIGEEGIADLVRSIAGTALTAAVGPDGAPVLTIGDLPDGYTVVAPPEPPEAEQAEIAVPTGPPCDAPSTSMCDIPETTVVAETGVGPPEVAIMSAGGTATPVDVDGGRGLMTTTQGRDDRITRVAWTDPSGVTALVFTIGHEPEETLAIARGIELVDEETWRATYPEWPEDAEAPLLETPGADTTEAESTEEPLGPETSLAEDVTTEPATETTEAGPAEPADLAGQGLATIPGLVADPGAVGTVVVIGASWCVPCVDSVATVADEIRERDRVDGSVVVPDDEADAALLDAAAAHDVFGTLEVDQSFLAAWGVDTFPVTLVAGPDGIIRSVLEGEVTRADLEAALDAAAR